MSLAAENSKLRVAVISDVEAQRINIKTLLENCGLQVVATGALKGDGIEHMIKEGPDVLLLDLDDNAEYELDFLDEVLSSDIPVLFNDGSAFQVNSGQMSDAWAKNTTSKLLSLVEVESAVPVTPPQESFDEDVPVELPIEDSLETAITPDDDQIEDFELDFDPDPPEISNDVLEQEHETEPELVLEPPPVPATGTIGHVVSTPDGHRGLIQEHPYSCVAQTVCVLGASMGGPQAVKRFLSSFTKNLPVAFVVAQHIGESFVTLLSGQLDKITRFKVIPAREGHVFRHNQVLVAQSMERLQIDEHGRVFMKAVREYNHYSPSIDDTMIDMALRYGSNTSAIVFSGMGNDGMKGSRVIASRGGLVWAQDAESSVISSMPDSANRAGIVSFRGTPEELAEKFEQTFGL